MSAVHAGHSAFGDNPSADNRHDVELALQASQWLGSSALQRATTDYDRERGQQVACFSVQGLIPPGRSRSSRPQVAIERDAQATITT